MYKRQEIAHLIDILLFIARKEGATTSQLMKKFGVSRTTIYRNVKSLSDIGLVAFIGPPKTGKYQLTINGKKKLAALAQGLDSI